MYVMLRNSLGVALVMDASPLRTFSIARSLVLVWRMKIPTEIRQPLPCVSNMKLGSLLSVAKPKANLHFSCAHLRINVYGDPNPNNHLPK